MPKRIEGKDEFSDEILSPSKGEKTYNTTVDISFQTFADRTRWLKNRVEEIRDILGNGLEDYSNIGTGSGEPSDDYGQDTDLFVDYVNGIIYYKKDGAWIEVINTNNEGILTINQINSVDRDFKIQASDNIEIISNTGGITIGSSIISGSIDINDSDNIYVITHDTVSGNSNPVVTLVAPTNTAAIYSYHIYDVKSNQFTVILSDIPETSGYKINWVNIPY